MGGGPKPTRFSYEDMTEAAFAEVGAKLPRWGLWKTLGFSTVEQCQEQEEVEIEKSTCPPWLFLLANKVPCHSSESAFRGRAELVVAVRLLADH
jgi:hypothetical protein